MYTYGWANTELQWNNLELENFKAKINEVTGVMAAVYGGDHKFFRELAPSPTPSSLFSVGRMLCTYTSSLIGSIYTSSSTSCTCNWTPRELFL